MTAPTTPSSTPSPFGGDEWIVVQLDEAMSVGVNARAVRDMEEDVRKAGGVSLRYGFLYGPGTWYHRNGASAQEIAEGRSPLVGDGGGLWPPWSRSSAGRGR